MKFYYSIKKRLKSILVISLLSCINIGLFSQVTNITINSPSGVNVCDTAVQATVEIVNVTNETLASGEVIISLPTGIYYEPASLNEVSSFGMTETTVTDLAEVTLSFASLPPGDKLEFEFSFLAKMDAIEYQDNNNVFRNNITVNSDLGSDTKQSNAYNLYYPVLSIIAVSPSKKTINSGETFTRDITVVNAGNGRVGGFYVTDTHDDGIDIQSVSNGILNTSKDRIDFDATHFTSVGNSDVFFDSNESFSFEETITAPGCQEGTITSTIVNGWGCEDTIVGSNNYAHVTVELNTPNINVVTTSELTPCFGTGEASQHTIELTNSGQGLATNIALDIFKSLEYEYDQDIFSKIDPTTITYQFEGAAAVSITPTESIATSTSGRYSCLGDGAIGRVILDLPDIEPGDILTVSFQTYHCNIDICEDDDVSGWRYDLNYTDFCELEAYNIAEVGQEPAVANLTIFPETPTDISDGEQDVFDFTVSSFEITLPVGEDASAMVVFTIPEGLDYISLEFDHNIIWEPMSEPVWDEDNNTLTAHYAVPPPTGFNIAKARFHLTLEGNCEDVDNTGGEKEIGLDIFYVPDVNCGAQIPLSCNNTTVVYLHCPNPDCIGLNFYNFTMERTSFGLPDNDQDGLPDASGELDFDVIKTHRVMFGDTVRGTFYGEVKTFDSSVEWENGFAVQNVDRGTALTPTLAYIKVWDESDNNFKEAVGLPLLSSSDGKFVYSLNVSDLASLDAAFNGFKYAEGDSIWVYAEYQITENIGNTTIQLKSTNDFYFSDNPIYGAGSEEQCEHFNDNFTLIGYYFLNESRNSFNITSCSRKIRQDFKLSIGDCCSNYAGGNLFPNEYRYWAHVKTATVEIPDNYTGSNIKVVVQRTVKTNELITETVLKIEPVSVDGNIYTFDLEQYYLSGDINYADDGFNGTLYMDISPNCDVPLNTYQDVTWIFDFEQSSYLGGGQSGEILADKTDRVKFNPPSLKIVSEDPIQDGLEKTVVWDLQIATSNSKVDANYAWLHFKNPSGDLNILHVINDATNDTIPITGDIYQLGDIDGGDALDLSVVASYAACTPDYMTVYSGYECTGFPATFADFQCSYTTLGLFVEPKPAKMQTALYGQSVGDECSNIVSLDLEILSAKFASVDNITVDIIPTSNNITFQNGSGQFHYPTDAAFESIADPIESDGMYQYSMANVSTTLQENGLPGVLNIEENRLYLKFNMVLSDDFQGGEYIMLRVSGTAVCGEDIPSIYLAYDPSVGFNINSLAGITNVSTNSWSASWGDYNRDGYDDLFVTTYDNTQTNYLYINNGDKTFTAVTTGDIANDKASSLASTWGDYNNDGYLDLFVANNVGFNNALYKNNGDGTFTKIVTGAIVEDGVYCHSAAWADFDNDGYLDLFVAEYFPTKTNHLFHNNGDETFTPIEDSPVVQDAGHSIGAAWGDYNNDGLMDLFVPNTEDEPNWLYKNIGNGNFVKVNEDVVSTPSKSVGCSWGDYNNDKYLDLYITNAGNEANFLYQNNGDGTFTTITEGHIVNEMSNSHGSVWFDIDNDGFLDLYVTNDQDEDNFLYRNNGDGTFTLTENEMTRQGGQSFGTAVSDYDNDGDLDIFVANHENENDFFFENTKGQCSSHFCVKVQGTQSNYSGIGVKAYAKANIYGEDVWQTREVSAQTGGGAGSQNSMCMLFGLGDATAVDSLILEWPSGYRVVYTDIDISEEECFTYIEGQGTYICGVAYVDENGNCQYDSDETLLKGAEITIEPNMKKTYTNSNGEYGFYMNEGDYTLRATDMLYYSNTCPDNNVGYTLSVEELADDICGNDFGYSTTTDKPDLVACLSTTMLRVNFTNKYTVTYENQGPVTAYVDTLIMTFDEGIDIVESSIPWDKKDGQTLYWFISEIAPQEQVIFYVTDSVTSDVVLGDYGVNTVRIASNSLEANYDNNGCEDTEEYVGSVDPNDKLVYPYDGVTKGEPITYKIRFQNVGNFPADNVMVYDTLVDQLNPASIYNIQTSHDAVFTILSENVLKWEFPEIYLADSVNNEPESHGYIQFSIYPYEEVGDFSEITNSAMIVFDYYQFTKTNTTSIQVRPEKDEGINIFDIEVKPNPVTDVINLYFTSDSKTSTELVIIKPNGQQVTKWIVEANIGYNHYALKVPDDLTGVIFVAVKTKNIVDTKKVVIKR